MVVVDALSVSYGSKPLVLRNVSIRIARGKSVALLGRSGSGKTTLAYAIAGLLPPGTAVSGTIRWEGDARCGFVFQSPGEALHPLLTVGKQLDEVLRANFNWSAAQRRTEIQRLLEEVGLEAGAVDGRYPHELSGGQRQRVSIAQAISRKPSLLIADEPTASLDTVTERAVVELVKRLQRDRQMAVLWITHSPLVGFQMDRIVGLRDGSTVEGAEAAAEFIQALPPRLGAEC